MVGENKCTNGATNPPDCTTFNTPLGPGFLSFYNFQQGRDSLIDCDQIFIDGAGMVPWCEIKIVDILPLWANNDRNHPLRRKLGTIPNPITTCDGRTAFNDPSSCATGPWEQTIGVY